MDPNTSCAVGKTVRFSIEPTEIGTQIPDNEHVRPSSPSVATEITLTNRPQIQGGDPAWSSADPTGEDADEAFNVSSLHLFAVTGVSADSTAQVEQDESCHPEGPYVEPAEPDVVGDDVQVELFVSLDLDLCIRILHPPRITEQRRRLFIYSVVSFHLGLYIGLVLYPIFSKAFRNFIK